MEVVGFCLGWLCYCSVSLFVFNFSSGGVLFVFEAQRSVTCKRTLLQDVKIWPR